MSIDIENRGDVIDFGFKERDTGTTTPYWTPEWAEPLLFGIRLDPDYRNLVEYFGQDAVRHIQEAGTALTALAGVTYQRPIFPDHVTASSRALLAAATSSLRRAAALFPPVYSWLSAKFEESSTSLMQFAQTGEWPSTIVDPPKDGLFFYCGALSTWHARDGKFPITLIIATESRQSQRAIDSVSAIYSWIPSEMSAGTGMDLDYKCKRSELPAMYAMDLIYVAGESLYGHKHFAHFFPLEVPNGAVENESFTVAFANILTSRVRNITRKIDHYISPEMRRCEDLARSTHILMRWFRGHDLSHFISPADVQLDVHERREVSEYGRYMLEESIADAGGLLTLVGTGAATSDLCLVMAELHRYGSRSTKTFADSASAAVLFGHSILEMKSRRTPSTASPFDDVYTNWFVEDPDAARSFLAGHIRELMSALYFQDSVAITNIGQWVEVGARYLGEFSAKLKNVPVDFHFIEG